MADPDPPADPRSLAGWPRFADCSEIDKLREQLRAAEADRARLQQEKADLARAVDQLADDIKAVQADYSEAHRDLTALRQALRQLAQQWQTEARQSASWTMTAVAKDSCAYQLLARLRERST